MGLTVFKTAGGSLGAVPGGFDSHTPLLFLKESISFYTDLSLLQARSNLSLRALPHIVMDFARTFGKKTLSDAQLRAF